MISSLVSLKSSFDKLSNGAKLDIRSAGGVEFWRKTLAGSAHFRVFLRFAIDFYVFYARGGGKNIFPCAFGCDGMFARKFELNNRSGRKI